MHSRCFEFVFEPQDYYDEFFVEMLEEVFEVVSINIVENKQQIVAYSRDEIDFISNYKYEVKKLESQNWLKDYVIEFEPFEVEDFMFYGIHQKTPPKTDKTLLQIYAATAFGSNHPTTVMCIKHICNLKKQGFEAKQILDMGTGSGILSLVAKRLWPNANITACDIDEEAVIVTQGNFNNNDVEGEVFCSDGYQKVDGKFDLILANILANPLIGMKDDAYNHINSNGYIILSGFNEEQKGWVVGEYEKAGFKHIKTDENQTWRASLCMS